MQEVIDWLVFNMHRILQSALSNISPLRRAQSWFAAQLKDAT